jgi:hypothetical protein
VSNGAKSASFAQDEELFAPLAAGARGAGARGAGAG